MNQISQTIFIPSPHTHEIDQSLTVAMYQAFGPKDFGAFSWTVAKTSCKGFIVNLRNDENLVDRSQLATSSQYKKRKNEDTELERRE